MPDTPSGLLTRMRSVNSSSPRLVWHGPDGRIELSGHVFDNWVAKTSNLLVDELDAADGTTVAFDLPVHWKTIAWAFACWQVGALPVLPAAADPAAPAVLGGDGPEDIDIVLSSRATTELPPPRVLVCVALGSLALRWDGVLPRGAVDYAAEVRSHGDIYSGPANDDDDAPLVRSGSSTRNWNDLQDLVDLPDDAAADGAPPTILVEPGVDLLRVLATALTVWNHDGALVLVAESVSVTDSMLAGERITGRLGTA